MNGLLEKPEIRDVPDMEAEQTKPALPDIIDAAEFIARPFEEPKQIVHGLLHQGSKLALGGGSKSFKTWTLLDLALSVAHGKPWLSFPTTAARVLFVNFEIQDFSWQRRIQAVADAKGIVQTTGKLSLLNLRGRAENYLTLIPQIQNHTKAHGFGLIILDPVYKLYGGADENSAGDIAGLLNGLESLAVNSGAAIAFGCHFSKGNQAGKESIDRISGSGVFARDPDSLLVMTRHEADGAFVVESTLRNFPPVEPFVVSWEFPLMRPDTALDPAKLKQSKGRKKEFEASQLLSILPGKGLSNLKWQKAAGNKHGISKRTFYTLRNELEQAGKILQSKVNGAWQPIKSK